MLITQGFEQRNITQLLDQEATVENTFKQLTQFIEKLQQGDIVYIHYSGHGQQVSDIDPSKHSHYKHIPHLHADEEDGYDEALALYDAPVHFYPGYDFSKHLIDDQIEYFQTLILSKIEKSGQLIMVFDSCHSGTVTRGSEPYLLYRGDNRKCLDPVIPVEKQSKFNKIEQPAQLIELKGCKDDQRNLEVVKGTLGAKKSYGSLSYFLCQTLNELKEKATYQMVFDILSNKIYANSKWTQEAVMETRHADKLFFGSGNLVMPDFYGISPAANLNQLIVRAGLIHGIHIGDSISIVKSANVEKVVLNGIVTDISGAECTIDVGKTITEVSKSSSSENHYSGFLAKRFYQNKPGQELDIALELENKSLENKIEKTFSSMPNIHFTNKAIPGVDYIIKGTKQNKVQIIIPESNIPLRDMPFLDLNQDKNLDTLKQLVEDALVVAYFNSLELNDPKTTIDVSITEMGQKEYQPILTNPAYQNKLTAVKLINVKLTNTSDQKLHIYVLHQSNSNVFDKVKALTMLPNESDVVPVKFGCEKGQNCELTDNLIVLSSLKELNLNYLTTSSRTLRNSTRGTDQLENQVMKGIGGENSKINPNPGISIQKIPFKIDVLLNP